LDNSIEVLASSERETPRQARNFLAGLNLVGALVLK
jgi:hypothetical protein